MRLPFRVVPVDDMFQAKINKIFKDLPNVFSVADHILVLCYNVDNRDHDKFLKHVMQIN